MFRGPYIVLGIEPRSDLYKASTLSTVLWLSPHWQSLSQVFCQRSCRPPVPRASQLSFGFGIGSQEQSQTLQLLQQRFSVTRISSMGHRRTIMQSELRKRTWPEHFWSSVTRKENKTQYMLVLMAEAGHGHMHITSVHMSKANHIWGQRAGNNNPVRRNWILVKSSAVCTGYLFSHTARILEAETEFNYRRHQPETTVISTHNLSLQHNRSFIRGASGWEKVDGRRDWFPLTYYFAIFGTQTLILKITIWRQDPLSLYNNLGGKKEEKRLGIKVIIRWVWILFKRLSRLFLKVVILMDYIKGIERCRPWYPEHHHEKCCSRNVLRRWEKYWASPKSRGLWFKPF